MSCFYYEVYDEVCFVIRLPVPAFPSGILLRVACVIPISKSFISFSIMGSSSSVVGSGGPFCSVDTVPTLDAYVLIYLGIDYLALPNGLPLETISYANLVVLDESGCLGELSELEKLSNTLFFCLSYNTGYNWGCLYEFSDDLNEFTPSTSRLFI